MPDRECPEGLNAEPVEGWVHLYGPYASTTMTPESAVKTAERLLLAAEEATEQRERKAAQRKARRGP
jgi:hypothetical protein